MNKNLIIIGAGNYGLVAKEIAEDMGCFDKIAFIDDNTTSSPNGIEIVGTTADIENLVVEYYNVIVAIGNPKIRLQLMSKLEEIPCRLVSLISPKSYISGTAQIGAGCIIEPTALIHTGCVVLRGCIVSAGAVVNHYSMLCDGVHIDCNATVVGNTLVPSGTTVCCGEVYINDKIAVEDLFFDSEKCTNKPQKISVKTPTGGPAPIDGMEYRFEYGV